MTRRPTVCWYGGVAGGRLDRLRPSTAFVCLFLFVRSMGLSNALATSTSTSSLTPPPPPIPPMPPIPPPPNQPFVHTLLLCRHGDSIWNGGEPGTRETFTGWTNVPLSVKGIQEAKATGQQVSEYALGIDACFTSILQRAQLTAHYCLWGFFQREQPTDVMSPQTYIEDYRLNERHYGALQGLVKEDVERGMYGHDPVLVRQWRRSWYTVPPLLEEDNEHENNDNNNDNDDPRRREEIQRFQHYCGGPSQVPRGESLDQVAEQRIRPFLNDVLCPILDTAAKQKQQRLRMEQEDSIDIPEDTGDELSVRTTEGGGGTGLVVAHANSLRALIGVLCQAKEDPATLAKLEALRLQTGVPLVLRFQAIPSSANNNDTDITTTRSGTDDGGSDGWSFRACDLNGIPFCSNAAGSTLGLVPELPVYPLSSIPLKPKPGSPAFRRLAETAQRAKAERRTVPF